MILNGYFTTIDNNNYYVEISKAGQGQIAYTIQENSPVSFDFNPVVISCDYKDTFKHLVYKTAEIRLVSEINLQDILFADKINDVNVRIYTGKNSNGELLYTGFVEPLVFNETYVHPVEGITINTTDKLGILKYKKYPELILNDLDKFDTFMGIITKIANYLNIDLQQQQDISIDPEIQQYLLTKKISNSIFVGDSKDDWMTCEEVLEEIGKYWGIWFQLDGNMLKMYNWHNITHTSTVLYEDDYRGNNTNISIETPYTQIRLTCDGDEEDDFVEFGDLTSPATHYVKYLKEIVSEGDGKKASENFVQQMKNLQWFDLDYDACYQYDNYCWIKENNKWNFGEQDETPRESYISYYKQGHTQQEVLQWLRNHPGKGGFFSFGRSEKITPKNNASAKASPEMNDCLIISVMGKDDVTDKTVYEEINNNGPVCSFHKEKSTGFTPTGKDTTNYILISGKILLNRLYALTGPVSDNDFGHEKYDNRCFYQNMNGLSPFVLIDILEESFPWLGAESLQAYSYVKNLIQNNGDYNGYHDWKGKAIPGISDNDDGALYQHVFYNGNTPNYEQQVNTPLLYGDLKQDKFNKGLQYEYSYIDGEGKKVDNTSKIPILQCSLRIGNKYCVERIDLGTSGWNRFDWLTEQEAPLMDGEKWKYFTIGIDPKIDDYIIGQEYDIQNNVRWFDDIDGKGTAIPIRYSDKLMGDVEFTIICPYLLTYTKTSKTTSGWWFWKRTHWPQSDIEVLQKLSSIIIKNLKLEIKSNSSHIMNNEGKQDLVYASNENTQYLEENEIETKIQTTLTPLEASNLQVEFKQTKNSVYNSDNTPFLGFESENPPENFEYIKPEHLFVNNFYEEYYKPREVVETEIALNENYIRNPEKYMFSFNYINGAFVPVSYEADLKQDIISINMKNMN